MNEFIGKPFYHNFLASSGFTIPFFLIAQFLTIKALEFSAVPW